MIDETVLNVLSSVLNLGDRPDKLTVDSRLLGVVPELDSMAVVSILAALEEIYGFTVDDDEIGAENFETVGSLLEFVKHKI